MWQRAQTDISAGMPSQAGEFVTAQANVFAQAFGGNGDRIGAAVWFPCSHVDFGCVWAFDVFCAAMVVFVAHLKLGAHRGLVLLVNIIGRTGIRRTGVSFGAYGEGIGFRSGGQRAGAGP